MDRVLEFGRRALFYVKVLSGYEERRIRSFRLELEKRLKKVLGVGSFGFGFGFGFVMIRQFLLGFLVFMSWFTVISW